MNNTNEPVTPVVYRKWKENGDIIALFPTIASDSAGLHCQSYMRVGQHGGADYNGVIAATTPATVEESQALHDELTRIGYNLKPCKRSTGDFILFVTESLTEEERE